MYRRLMFCFLALSCCLVNGRATSHSYTLNLHMRNATSNAADALVCSAIKLDPQEAYIVEFEPQVSQKVTHHMNVYGCPELASDKPFWVCPDASDRTPRAVCNGTDREILFAWGLDAATTSLPEGVGFRVGDGTDVKYLVVQMHYVDAFTDGFTDNAGVRIHMTNDRLSKQAAYYVLGSFGYIPPMTPEYYMESACVFQHDYNIYPVAYRTHSHSLGRVTSGYLVRNNHWTEIGRMDPQQPQTFYNVTTHNLEIRPGDFLAARCTMSSKRMDYTKIGPTHHDEMCNFYILYYTYREENVRVEYCFHNAQAFRWQMLFKNIPSDASSLEGVTVPSPHSHHNDKEAREKDELEGM